MTERDKFRILFLKMFRNQKQNLASLGSPQNVTLKTKLHPTPGRAGPSSLSTVKALP